MKKRSLVSQIVFALWVIVPILCFVVVFPRVVDPVLNRVFGAYATLATVCFYWLAFGLFFKLMSASQMATDVRIIPQTPAEFAGVQGKPASFAAPPSPLPEVPQPGPRGTKPAPVVQLDFSGLETATAALLAAGFTVACEGALDYGRSTGAAMFERMLIHPSGTVADVYQVFPGTGKPLPLSVALSTPYPDDWSLGDSNQPATWWNWIWIRPRAIGKRHEPEVSVEQMWQEHLARRSKFETGLGLMPLRRTVEEHFEHSRRLLRWMRLMLFRRSLLIAWLKGKFYRTKSREWWGDFHKFAKSPAASSDVRTTSAAP